MDWCFFFVVQYIELDTHLEHFYIPKELVIYQTMGIPRFFFQVDKVLHFLQGADVPSCKLT